MTPEVIPPVSDETLAELLELEAKATPGEWQWGYGYSDVLCEEGILDINGHAVSVNCGRGSGDITPEDASLVISSRNYLRSIVRELQGRRAAEKKEWRIVSYEALCRHEDRWYSHFVMLDNDDLQKRVNASITENPEDYRNIRKQYRIAAGPWTDAEPARAEKEGKNR